VSCVTLSYMGTVPYTLRLPVELVETIDVIAKSRGWSRAKVIIEACRATVEVVGVLDAGFLKPPAEALARLQTDTTTKSVKPRPPQINLPQAKPPMPQRPANRLAKPPGEWCPTSKCPHNWMNSFVCEQNGGGCKR
jgi:predicted DNA-binding protein